MLERPAAPHGVFHVRQCRRFARVDVILAAHRQRNAIAFGRDDAGRPDFNIEFVYLAGFQRLVFVMRVIRPVRQRQFRVELAVRCAQPALGHRRVGIERTLEHDFFTLRIEYAQHREYVRVRCCRRNKKLQRRRPCDLGVLLQRRRRKNHAVAHRFVGDGFVRRHRGERQAPAFRIQIKIRPLRARNRPFVLRALDKFFAGMAHLQQHFRLLVPAVLFALQKVVEKTLLQPDAVIGVKRRPVRAAVRFQPFVFRCRAHVTLEVAARMQALPAPVRRRQQRHRDFRQIAAALLVIGVIERTREKLAPHVFAVVDELLFTESFGPAHEFAGDAAVGATFADAVLHRLHLHVLPVLAEHADDAAVACRIAEIVDPTFPHADRRKMRRLHRCRAPLVARVIRNAVQPDFAAAPRLRGGPFNAVVKILRLARIVMAKVTGRAARAARIDAHADIAVGHPLLGVDDFPRLVLVGGARDRIGIFAAHDVPRGLVAFLECEAFAVRPVTYERRIFSICGRTEHIGAHDHAVVHRNRHIPVDAHAIADFGFVFVHDHRVNSQQSAIQKSPLFVLRYRSMNGSLLPDSFSPFYTSGRTKCYFILEAF